MPAEHGAGRPYDLKVFFTVVTKPRPRWHPRTCWASLPPSAPDARANKYSRWHRRRTTRPGWRPARWRGGCRSSRASSPICRPAARSPATRCPAVCRPGGSGPGRAGGAADEEDSSAAADPHPGRGGCAHRRAAHASGPGDGRGDGARRAASQRGPRTAAGRPPGCRTPGVRPRSPLSSSTRCSTKASNEMARLTGPPCSVTRIPAARNNSQQDRRRCPSGSTALTPSDHEVFPQQCQGGSPRAHLVETEVLLAVQGRCVSEKPTQARCTTAHGLTVVRLGYAFQPAGLKAPLVHGDLDSTESAIGKPPSFRPGWSPGYPGPGVSPPVPSCSRSRFLSNLPVLVLGTAGMKR